MSLHFYYDIVCPYAYMASTRVAALAARAGVDLVYEPVLLGGLFQHHQSASVPAQTWTPAKQILGLRDIHRSAERLGVPMELNSGHPRRTVKAMRLILATPEAQRTAVADDLFAAYHIHQADITDLAVLTPLAERHGVDIARIEDPAIKEELKERTARAAQAGVFGVPTFRLGDQQWWGADRIHFVESALAGTRVEPEAGQSPASADVASQITFFHDFSSPFSYLASTQIDRVAAPSTVQWRPILLGALFKSIGTPNVPLMTMSEAKRRWVFQDLLQWAKWWDVPFQWPTVFPVRTVLPLRVSIQDHRATAPLYRALWADNRDIGQPEVVAGVLTEAGLDSEALIAGAQDPQIKAQLRTNTEDAQAAGVCGVPSFQIDETVVWGQDRLHFVREMMDGWRPREAP
jgi:2-hydroxychromene-2-carboxylate isomerase